MAGFVRARGAGEGSSGEKGELHPQQGLVWLESCLWLQQLQPAHKLGNLSSAEARTPGSTSGREVGRAQSHRQGSSRQPGESCLFCLSF